MLLLKSLLCVLGVLVLPFVQVPGLFLLPNFCVLHFNSMQYKYFSFFSRLVWSGYLNTTRIAPDSTALWTLFPWLYIVLVEQD